VRSAAALQAALLLLELSEGAQGTVPEWIRILPSGWVDSVKGRFLVDAQSRRQIITACAQRGLDVVFDYEHQTLKGEPAPAAGWIRQLEDRGDDGLWGRVEWTEKAKGFLANREYRYHSPVVLVNKKDSRAVYLHSVALTNTPAINHLEPLVASATFTTFNLSLKEDGTMDWLEYLKSILQLPADATWEQVVQTVQNLARQAQEGQTAVSANKALLAALDLAETATPEQARGKILSLKNPAGYVPMEEHLKVKTELDQLTANDLVEKALSAGKITPAQKAWAAQYALKDPAGFSSFIEQAPVVVALNTKIVGGGNPPAQPQIEEIQLHVNNLLGVTAEDMQKYGGNA
jgi:phage I-like protein